MLRTRVDNITLDYNGQVVDLDLDLIGLGTVTGRVLMPDSSSAGDIAVTVRSLTPVYGRTYSATTDAAGYYTVERVSVGDIYVTSGNMAQQIWGQGEGEITDDGDSINVDIMLDYNAITLPRDIYDVNKFRYDIQEDGTLRYGRNVFYPVNSLGITGAATLSVVGRRYRDRLYRRERSLWKKIWEGRPSSVR